MKKILMVAMFCLPCAAWAGHLDVIASTLKDSCSLDTYLEIVGDFNENWAKDHGYRAEIAVPLQSHDMSTIFWLGRSENVAAFGAAADAWIEEVQDPESVAGQLDARFGDCVVEPWEGRRSYLVY